MLTAHAGWSRWKHSHLLSIDFDPFFESIQMNDEDPQEKINRDTYSKVCSSDFNQKPGAQSSMILKTRAMRPATPTWISTCSFYWVSQYRGRDVGLDPLEERSVRVQYGRWDSSNAVLPRKEMDCILHFPERICAFEFSQCCTEMRILLFFLLEEKANIDRGNT